LRRREELIRRSAALKAHHPNDHAPRRGTLDEIRRLNDQLVRCDAGAVQEIERRVPRLEEQWRQGQIARDREYFFALHRRSDIAQLVRTVREQLVRG
jgi:hypothetical protein